MNFTKIDKNYIVLFCIFFGAYYGFSFLKVNWLLKLFFIGLTVGVSTYILYGIKTKFLIKIIAIIFFLGINLSICIYTESKINPDNHFAIQKLQGKWQTDTADGFSINLIIEKDSAYLSQSNLTITRGYSLTVNKDLFIMRNGNDKQYSWTFFLKEKDSVLLLKNEKDSLLFQKLN